MAAANVSPTDDSCGPAQGAAATKLETERPAARIGSPQVEFAVAECGAASAGENEARSVARDPHVPPRRP